MLDFIFGKNRCLFLGCAHRKLNKEYVKKLAEDLGCYIFKDEPCCGIPLRNLGYEEDFKNQLRKLETWKKDHSIDEFIVLCPSCYQILKKYKTKFILEVLKPNKKISGKWYIHIPCHAYELKDVFEKVCENLFEDFEFGDFCCGGGSNLPMNYPEISKKMAEYIIDMAKNRNIATECPMCYFQLKKFKKEVYLISELIKT